MNRNPILNSPDDITDELIQQIIDNNLDSLTINYEFTNKKLDEGTADDWLSWHNGVIWHKKQMRINPFWRADKITFVNLNFSDSICLR